MNFNAEKTCSDQCPRCGASGNDIGWGKFEFEEEPWQEGTCKKCGCVFHEVYKYSVTVYTEDAEAKEEIETLKYKCPKCNGYRLECCEDGPYASEVLTIDREGDFEWGEISAVGMVVRFQCLECGYVLKDSEGESLTDNDDVVKWIEQNCSQK